MGTSDSERNPVEELAEEFVERYRRGEQPALQEYIDRFPQWADMIRALFPALMIMEKVRPEPADDGRPENGWRAGATGPERLGDYRIVREVGRGGMGVVYEAEQESLGRHVAVKVLSASALLDPNRVQRFQREARAVARLHHTNIVPVFGVGQQDGLHYYVMQFIQGLGLDEVLAELKRLRQERRSSRSGLAPARPGPPTDVTGDASVAEMARSLLTGQFAGIGNREPEAGKPAPAPEASAADSQHSNPDSRTSVHLPGQTAGSSLSETGRQYWRSVARIGIQVAEALAHAASQNVLHRDIKPSNLLLDTQGTVWVTDFGLAKAADDAGNLTHTGDIIGTLRYLAPERFQGRGDLRSDLYSLGLTLYELLTLRPAFDARDRSRLIDQVLHHDPPRPHRVEPAVPRDLETVVLKSIARDPEQRYQTPDELADDLRRFLDDRPIRARRLGPLVRLWRWCRRNPTVAILTGSVAGLLLLLAVGSLVAALWLDQERNLALYHEGEKEKALRAEAAARQDALQKLRDSRIAEAQARRWSGQVGRHFLSLKALREAARIRPGLELRNDVVACIPLVDLQLARKWEPGIGIDQNMGIVFDARLERYAIAHPKGGVSLRRVADNTEIIHLTVPGSLYGGPSGPLSADEQFLVGRYDQKLIAVWSLKQSKPVVTIPMPPGPSGYFAQVLTADNRQLLAGFGDRTLRIFDLPSGHEVKRFTLRAAVAHMALHPDGRKLLLSLWNERLLQVLDLATSELQPAITVPSQVNAVAWHPASTLVVGACADHKIRGWDFATGKLHANWVGHQSNVMSCSFNHEGNLLVSTGWDGTTRLWDLLDGKQLVAIPGSFVRFSADGGYLAVARGSEVGLWEIAKGREFRSFFAWAQKRLGPWNVAFHPTGRVLAASDDEGVRLWDVLTGTELGILPVGLSREAFFTPAGDELLTASEQGLQRWPVALSARAGTVKFGPPQVLHGPLRSSPAASLSADGQHLAAVADYRRAMVLDLDRPTEPRMLGIHANLSNVATSADGRWVVTGTQHGSGLKVWDARKGTLVKDLEAGNYGGGLFSPDGKWLVTSSVGEGTDLREIGTWKIRHHLSKERSSGLAFAQDSSLLAVSYGGGTIVLIHPASGRELTRLPAPNSLPNGGMAFSADGSWLAVTCYNHHNVQVWDLRAIRARLRALKLDWDPALDPEPARRSEPLPLRLHIVRNERDIGR
jgi:serine/threonine protein kinase/WD40 repeat protein